MSEPLTLEGKQVRLVPLRDDHCHDLFNALKADPSIFRWWRTPAPATLPEMHRWVEQALAPNPEGPSIAFAQLEKASGKAVGTTSYLHIREADRALEIGRTWIGKAWQRTAINTEAKYLLLRHAFEERKSVRVELVTDERNERSRRAIERLGGKLEGTLRKHRIVQDGFARNTVVYSILDTEWPEVKARLTARLENP